MLAHVLQNNVKYTLTRCALVFSLMSDMLKRAFQLGEFPCPPPPPPKKLPPPNERSTIFKLKFNYLYLSGGFGVVGCP